MATDYGPALAETFEGLSKLLCPEEPPIDPSTVSRAAPPSGAGPGAIGPAGTFPGVVVPAPKGREDDNAIWSADEVRDAVEDTVDDGRPCPHYEWVYKQAVETTDTYLGMDPMGKDPTSTSCEDITLHVTLPDVQHAKDIDVDLKPTWIIVSTGSHKLSTYLPHKVDEDKSKAEWDVRTHKLKITMRIVREDL